MRMLQALLNHTVNGTSTGKKEKEPAYIIPVQVVVLLFILILVVNLIGNSVVVLVIVKKRTMQTFTNWLILNLSVADLSVALICIPLEIPLEILGSEWIFGKFFCTIFYPIQTAATYGSVFTLVFLSCSRYWGILHPFRTQPTIFVAKLLICIVWVTSFIVVIPYMMTLQYDSELKQCIEVWNNSSRRIYTIALFVFQYILPLLIITLAYGFILYEIVKKPPTASRYGDIDEQKETKKLTKLLVIITVTFALCVLPYHVTALIGEFYRGEKIAYFDDINLGSYIILYLHSALNPVIYNAFSSSFRESFSELSKRISTCLSGNKGNNTNGREGRRETYLLTKTSSDGVTFLNEVNLRDSVSLNNSNGNVCLNHSAQPLQDQL